MRKFSSNYPVLAQNLAPICTEIGMFSNNAYIRWIPPTMSTEQTAIFHVFYVINGQVYLERTMETSLTIPVERNATEVKAIVQTITQSETPSLDYTKGSNECRFYLNITDRGTLKYFIFPKYTFKLYQEMIVMWGRILCHIADTIRMHITQLRIIHIAGIKARILIKLANPMKLTYLITESATMEMC